MKENYSRLDLSKTSLSIEKELEANPADSRSKGSGWATCQMPYLAWHLLIFIKIYNRLFLPWQIMSKYACIHKPIIILKFTQK